MRKILLTALLLSTVAVVNASKDCRFAPTFQRSELLSNPDTRQEFFSKVVQTEAKFLREIGYDKETGLTIAAVPVNSRTGMPELDKSDTHSLAKNEAIHIALLAKSLSGDSLATQIYTPDEALSILAKKLHSLKDSSDKHIQWALFGTQEILEDRYPSQTELIAILQQMTKDFNFSQELSYNTQLDLLLKPLLSNPEFRAKFNRQQRQQANSLLKGESTLQGEHLASFYLVDQTHGAIWHHSSLLNEKKQTRYGAVTSDLKLDWDSKMALLSIMDGGLASIAEERLTNQGLMDVFLVTNSSFVSSQAHYSFVSPSADFEPELFTNDFTSCRLIDVPTDFVWGVATAAYQIEGAAYTDGRAPSIWDDFCKLNGTVNNHQNGDVADDFYHKYKGDVALMKSMGIKHFRMSLSWSRILPDGTTDKGVNGLGVAFYNYVINELIAAGITPWVTLHHWDTPSALHNNTDTGSFLGRDIIDAFDNYADFVFAAYGDRVKHWITLNEPWTYSINGYASGVFAPGRCSEEKCKYTGNGGNTSTEPYIVTHHMMLAHGKAAKTYKNKYQQTQGGVIGFTTNTDFNVPYNPAKPEDVEAASRQMAFAFAWFVDPVIFGKYPDEMTSLITDGRLPQFTPEESAMLKGSVDYIGLNHYSSSYTMDDPTSKGGAWWSDSHTSSTKTGMDGKLIGPQAESPWLNVYPQGLGGILKWINKRYDTPIIYVFENGVSVPHENEMPITEALHDNFRIDFYKGYIQSAIDAMTTDGVDLRGYFAWSFMDNFEWADGYSTRFGMTYVDYPNDQKRYAKDSLYWYSMFSRTGNINGTYTNMHAMELEQQGRVFLQ